METKIIRGEGRDTYVMEIKEKISDVQAAVLREEFQKLVGKDKHLIIMDSGSKLNLIANKREHAALVVEDFTKAILIYVKQKPNEYAIPILVGYGPEDCLLFVRPMDSSAHLWTIPIEDYEEGRYCPGGGCEGCGFVTHQPIFSTMPSTPAFGPSPIGPIGATIAKFLFNQIVKEQTFNNAHHPPGWWESDPLPKP